MKNEEDGWAYGWLGWDDQSKAVRRYANVSFIKYSSLSVTRLRPCDIPLYCILFALLSALYYFPLWAGSGVPKRWVFERLSLFEGTAYTLHVSGSERNHPLLKMLIRKFSDMNQT